MQRMRNVASDPEGLLFSTEDLNIVKMSAF